MIKFGVAGLGGYVLLRLALRWGPTLLAWLPAVWRAVCALVRVVSARVGGVRSVRVRRERVVLPPVCVPGRFGVELYNAMRRFCLSVVLFALPICACGMAAYWWPFMFLPYGLLILGVLSPLRDVALTGYLPLIIRRGIACPVILSEGG